MAKYVYDKKTCKFVPEKDRTDPPKQKSAYITKNFKTVYSKQLAADPQAYKNKDPACGYSNYRELEQKAKATGQAVNVHRDD